MSFFFFSFLSMNYFAQNYSVIKITRITKNGAKQKKKKKFL